MLIKNAMQRQKRLIITLMACNFLAIGCSGQNSSPNILSSNVAEPTAITQTSTLTQANLQKLTYKIGPFSLPAQTPAEEMRESPGLIKFHIEEPVWMTGFEFKLEDASGTKLPRQLLNLAILTNGSEQNPLCADKQVSNPFAGATSTVQTIKLPDNDGYPLLPEDEITAKVILQNYSAHDYNNIFFTFTLTAVPMKSAKNYSDVLALFLDVDECGHAPIALPPKEFTKKQAEFKLPESGFLTRVYGLLQDYGIEMSLSANGQLTPFWIAMAEQSEEHKIIGLPPFEDPAGISLKGGDKLSLSVSYENPLDKWQNASASAMVYIRRGEAPTKGLEAQKILLAGTL